MVVLDADVPKRVHRDRIRYGELVCVPVRTAQVGTYIVATGYVDAGVQEIATPEEDSDLYVCLGALIPGIVEKACCVEEEREDPPTPEGWRAGGVARHAANGGLAVATDVAQQVEVGHEEMVCVYDLVTCGAAFESFRYVLDARQPSANAVAPELFERRHVFPALLAWRYPKPRVSVRDFTKNVYA